MVGGLVWHERNLLLGSAPTPIPWIGNVLKLWKLLDLGGLGGLLKNLGGGLLVVLQGGLQGSLWMDMRGNVLGMLDAVLL